MSSRGDLCIDKCPRLSESNLISTRKYHCCAKEKSLKIAKCQFDKCLKIYLKEFPHRKKKAKKKKTYKFIHA